MLCVMLCGLLRASSAELPPPTLPPASCGRKGSRAFIPLLGSWGLGAEGSALPQRSRGLRWRFWSPASSCFSHYHTFKSIIYIGWLLRSRTGIVLMGWLGRAAALVLALCAHSLPLLLTFSRRISVLDVAGADVSPSLLVLWACKLGNPVLPSAAWNLGWGGLTLQWQHHKKVLWITRTRDKCF